MLSAAVAIAPQSICALEIDPAAEEAFFAGVALLEAGDPSGAVAMFDQALRIDKQLRRVHFYRARAWGRLGDIDEARADVQKATEGNKAACARVRKAMMEVKNLAGDIRKEMLELRDSGGQS